jgi:NSS family neurotransmitter:Na+ symporter
MLLMLGIDSAFSLVEAVNTGLRDRFPSLSQKRVSLFLCSLGFFCGSIFTTNAGLYLLDIIDHFLVEFGLVALGLLHCIAVGWGYGANKLRRECNGMGSSSIGRWWSFSIKYFIPIVLLVLLSEQLLEEMSHNYEGYPSWAIAMGASITSLPFLFIIKSLLKPKKEPYLEQA